MKNTVLFIWRFQPVHNGHIDAIRQLIKAWLTKILIGVGSCEKELTPDNPFKYCERQQLLKLAFQDAWVTEYIQDIIPIPDFDNDSVWKNYIIERFPSFDYVWTWNPHVKDIFQNIWKQIINFDTNTNIKASNIRHLIYTNRTGCMKSQLSESVWNYIVNNNFPSIFHLSFKNFLKPSIAVDWICKDSLWNIILIKRNNPPFGYAIPGGFIDYWEDPTQAIIRELSEELWLPQEQIHCEKLIWVYGSPDRDPRWHVISIVYECELLTDNIAPWDDASEIIRIDKSNLHNISLAFDHEKIINDYASQ